MKKKRRVRNDATLPAIATPASGVPLIEVDVVADGGKDLSGYLQNVSEDRRCLIERVRFTNHSLQRFAERNIKLKWVLMTIAWGRRIFSNGAVKYLFGRKETERFGTLPKRFLPPNGLVVVCDPLGVVLTVYRDISLKCLKRTGQSGLKGTKRLRYRGVE